MPERIDLDEDEVEIGQKIKKQDRSDEKKDIMLLASSISSFMPEIIKWAVNGTDNIVVPYADGFYCAALFADVSGFTAMTEALSRRGNIGSLVQIWHLRLIYTFENSVYQIKTQHRNLIKRN